MVAKIIGASPVLQQLRTDALRIAKIDAPVLITGETGTGKDLFARFIYANSRRGEMPFRIVNCAAISSELFEAEFFGYEKGAFTGASRSHKGHFRLANKGTLILDEIAEIQPRFQAKLLRAIENNELYPIGSEKIVRVDVRIIALTNRDLQKEIDTGRFRQDLFYRLNTFHLHLPPLRERKEDIPRIAAWLLNNMLNDRGAAVEQRVQSSELTGLSVLSLPGNVRDLQTITRRLMLDFPGKSFRKQLSELVEMMSDSEADQQKGEESLTGYLRRMEYQKINSVLESCDFNITRSARRLGLSRQALQHRIKKLKQE